VADPVEGEERVLDRVLDRVGRREMIARDASGERQDRLEESAIGRRVAALGRREQRLPARIALRVGDGQFDLSGRRCNLKAGAAEIGPTARNSG